MPTTHELARNFRELAEKLESAPEFEIPERACHVMFHHYGESEKPSFLHLARALGGAKKTDNWNYTLTSTIGMVHVDVTINREVVCRLVKPAQEAVYECEPLLSAQEEAQIGGAQ